MHYMLQHMMHHIGNGQAKSHLTVPFDISVGFNKNIARLLCRITIDFLFQALYNYIINLI